MADFPDTVFNLRDIENLPGITYDADNKKALFAEDLQNIAAEISAIEEHFQYTGHYYDTDVPVTEFFGSAINLGTGGYCRIDILPQGLFIYIRIEIVIGTSPSLGTLPFVIKSSDLPYALPTFTAQKPVIGAFGGVSESGGSFQMYAPALNNITGYGQGLLFFKESGAAFTDYLLGTSSLATLGAGDSYNGMIIVPSFNILGVS